MGDTVEISIPVDAEAAAILGDSRNREAIGRIISRMLRARPSVDPLLDAMDRMAAEAAINGLTEEILEEEFAAYNSERRGLTAEELHADYAAMAADEEAEADALEWIEGLVGDVATEPSRHER